MLHFLSFALFSTILIISIAAIVATIKAELPYVLRALGVDPASPPSLRPSREARVRVTRRAQPAARTALRAAA